ncbi:MAG: Ig-like domain-containing protein [Defluviitaleaceae bacterium]|nr:Ig-like domain-containing protein [Defluviitaleaceae bacterium]
MLSKFSKLSKNDKKLIITFSSIAIVLILAVVSAALIISFSGGEDSDYADFAENGNGVFTQNGGFVATAPGEDFFDFEIAPSALGRITIEALSYSEFGVDVDSDFLVSSDTQSLSKEHLTEFLSTRDNAAFSLEPHGSNRFLLQFEEELAVNSVVNFVYRPLGFSALSHAFQTVDVFRVTNTSPADATFNVPNNAGIEITFNQPIEGGLASFERAFSIDPPVAEGSFFKRDNTYIFAPNAMEFNRMYTVTIREGLVGVSGEVLAENFVFSFTTTWGTAAAPAFSVIGSAYETFLPWNEVFVALNISRDFHGREFNVRLYELPDIDSFLNFTGVDNAVLIEESVKEVQTFGSEWDSFHFLFLGRTLPEGVYVAEITSVQQGMDIVAHKFIQVSPISVYSLSVDDEALFWVNDAATGEPARGARIDVGGVTNASTNNEGIAIIPTLRDRRASVVISYRDYLPFAYVKPTFGNRELMPNERFLFYMYTDRPTYRPNDTVDVFGVIRPRYGQAHSAEDIFTLRIGDMIEMPITLDRFNSFVMRIPVTNMFGFTDISVEVNGERLMSSWVEFLDYANIPFVINGSLDRLVYAAGEYAQAEIRLTTFAGRPVDGVQLRTHSPRIPDLITNEYGIAAGALPIVDEPHLRRDWQPHWSSFWYGTVGEGQASQGIGLPHIVAQRDTMLEAQLNDDIMTITSNRIIIENIEEAKQGSLPWVHIHPDIFRGAAVDVDFEIHITRFVTTQTVRTQQYDHINRRMVTTYDFNTTSSLYRIVQGTTENGRAVVTDLPVSDSRLINYRMEIFFNDTQGRPTMSWVQTPWRNAYVQTSTMRHFFFPLSYGNTFGIGETIDVTIVESEDNWWWSGSHDEAIILTEGRIIAILARDGIIDVATGDVSGVQLTFTEAAVSNAILFGAFFDGQYIFPVPNPISIRHDFSERELEVELTFCQEEYRPGDEVTVQIHTEKPAQVLISVVDESAIQSSRHNTNFLSRLYQSSTVWAWMMNTHQFASHTQHNFGNFGGGAEGGGGDDGGDSISFRDFFVDNPVFEKVLTTDGVATLTFTLPDQITSWRVTALALTECGFAGESVVNITSTLNFYVELLYTNEFIVGDDIAAVVRSFRPFGRTFSDVHYTFNILSGDEIIFTDSQTIEASRNPRAVFNAGKLPPGDYKMQVIATSGDYTDALERPFTVAEYALIIQNHLAGEISTENPHSLHPALFNMRPFPVRLTLTNANIRPLTRILNSTFGRNSSRTDYIAAAAFRDYFFTGESDPYAVRAIVHANHNGGIPELTYENPDLFYTARFAASFPEFVNPSRIKEFVLPELASENPARRAAALLALAGIGEPVLLKIQQEARDTNPSEYFRGLKLAAALVAAGDDNGAANLITRLDKPSQYLLIGFGAEEAPYATFADTSRETVQTLHFFINTAINPTAAWQHINRPEQNLFVSDIPERINFVRRAVFLGDTISEFEYTLHDQTHTAILQNFDRLHLHLSYEQFHSLNLTPISGETAFHLSFQSYNSSNWNPADSRIQITRTITPAANLYRVTLNITLPHDARGTFTIYDRLPSNKRFIPSRHFHTARPWYSVNHTQRQLIQLTLHANPNAPLTRTLHYYALSLYDADMAEGTTYITNHNLENHIWGSTR